MVYLPAGTLIDEFSVEIVFAWRIVVTAAEIHIARQQAVGGKEAAEVDVGHHFLGGPLIRGSSIVVLGTVKRSVAHLPLDRLLLLFVVAHGGCIVGSLVPLVSVGILSRHTAYDIEEGIGLIALSIHQASVIDPGLRAPLLIAVIARRRSNHNVSTHHQQTFG